MTTGPRDFWNQLYDRPDYRYGAQPNAWLVTCAGKIPAGGRVLCVGDGEGRNGVWLAEQGFEVVTIDASNVGVEKARDLAVERGVEVDAQCGLFPDDLQNVGDGFDAVVLIYIHAPPAGRRTTHGASIDALRDGGVIVLEAFSPEQLGRSSGGPQREDMLYTVDTLADDFEGLHIEAIQAEETVLDEGPGHAGEAAVVRLLARRTA